MHQAPPVTIEQYRNRSDKQKAIFFVGRRDIVAGIETTVADIESRIKAETSDTGLQPGKILTSQDTWLIQGAPGAGKSALLSHLESNWARREGGPVTVRIFPNNLRNETIVTGMIADCKIPNYGEEILNTVRTVEASAGVNTFIQAGGKVIDSEQSSSGLVLEHLARLYSKKAAAVSKRVLKGGSLTLPELRPIVVMIDEVQFFEPEDVPVLRKLHTGDHGLPILALLCGLAYSESMLAAARISRFAKTDDMSHVQTMAPLEAGEAAESVRAMLNGYQIKNRHNSDLPDKIDAWCDGWPQFLEHYMIPLTRQLSANGLDLAKIDESAVRSDGDENRVDYYSKRLGNSPISDGKKLLADVTQLIGPDGCERGEILNLLEDRRWVKGKYFTNMPARMEPTEFIEAMIVAGVVHSKDTTLTIPIPPFRRYLINRVK